MRIASQCLDRALLLLQVAQECPQVEEHATYLAREWLAIAAMRIGLGMVERPENEVGPN